MGQGKGNQMAVQLIRDLLKDRGERVQQHQIQEFLEFIEEICPQFSEHRTLDVVAWKEVGIMLSNIIVIMDQKASLKIHLISGC